MRHACYGWLVLGLVMGLVGGCGTPAATAPPAAPERSGALMDPMDARQAGYAINWATNLAVPADQQIRDVRVLGDLIVVIEQPGNLVSAVQLRDGAIRWNHTVGDTNRPLYKAIRYNDRIHVNSSVALYSLAARTGTLKHVANLDNAVAGGPERVQDEAIFGAVSGRVFAHNLQSSSTRWSYKLTDRILAEPAVHRDRVFVADAAGVYAMIRASTGELMWRNHTWGPVTAAPVMDNTNVYIASQDQSLYALAQSTGRDRWIYRTETRLIDSPMLANRTIFLPLGNEGMAAIDASNGEQRWRLDYRALPIKQTDDRLLLATSDSLQHVEADTGRLLGESPTNAPLRAVLEGPDQSLILVSAEGQMLRLNKLP